MTSVKRESLAFLEAKQQSANEARQRAALFLIGGVDIQEARQTTGADRDAIVRRLKRLIERERLKGARHHWSYDLNRHIALGQALRYLTDTNEQGTAPKKIRSRRGPRRHTSRRKPCPGDTVRC